MTGRVAAIAACFALLPAIPVAAGTIVTREDALACREEVTADETYRLDTTESDRKGQGFRAGSSVTICRLCRYPLEITAGTSFTAVDVDLFLRSVKGKVQFTGNMLPFISHIQEQCAHRREEQAEGRKDP